MWLIKHWYEPIIGPFNIVLGHETPCRCSHENYSIVESSDGKKYTVFNKTLYRVKDVD